MDSRKSERSGQTSNAAVTAADRRVAREEAGAYAHVRCCFLSTAGPAGAFAPAERDVGVGVRRAVYAMNPQLPGRGHRLSIGLFGLRLRGQLRSSCVGPLLYALSAHCEKKELEATAGR
jgi:hypothetical protein